MSTAKKHPAGEGGSVLRTLRKSAAGAWRFLTESGLSFFPLRQTLRGYNRIRFRSDVHSALNVALMGFPQGMAYALIAGLPVEFGIFASAITCIVAPFFLSCRFTIVGPTNATAVMVFGALSIMGESDNKYWMAACLVFLVGIFLILAAVCRVASLTQYISASVVTGYVTAAALLIIANQIHYAFGFELENTGVLWHVVYETFGRLPQTHAPTLILSLATLVIAVVCARYVKAIPNVAINLVAGALMAWAMGRYWGWNVETLNAVHASSWKFSFPDLTLIRFGDLATTALAIVFLTILESTSVAKSLAQRSGERVDANQELLGLGVANLACAFSSGMPSSGSPVRSTLNWASGGNTPVASILSGLLCVAGVFVIGPFIAYVPKACLAVSVLVVGWSLVNERLIRIAVRSTSMDRIAFFATLITAILFRLDFAIYFGVATSIILFLRKASAPELVEYSFNDEGHLYEIQDRATRENPAISIVHVEGDLFFGAAEVFREQIRAVCADENLRIIILRLKNARHLDGTCIMSLEELIKFLRESGRELIVSGARREIYRTFRDSGLLDVLGKENFFMGSTENPNVSTRNALLRAKELLHGRQAEIKIFYDPSKQAGKGQAEHSKA